MPYKIARLLLLLFLAALPLVPVVQAQPQGAAITAATDRLFYSIGDEITFTIDVNSGGTALRGDLYLDVFPAASPLATELYAPELYAGEPLASEPIEQDYSVEGQGNLTFQTDTAALDLGSGGYPVRVSLRDGEEVVASGYTWLAIVDSGDRDPIDLILVWTVANQPERNAEGEFVSLDLLDRCRSELDRPDNLLQHEELGVSFRQLKTVYSIEPLLLDQLQDLADGFQLRTDDDVEEYAPTSGESLTADACLKSLGNAAAMEHTDVLSTPYTFTHLPLLAKEGWSDGSSQYRIGDDILTKALMLPTEPVGAYIPLLDLTTDSLRYIAATGGEYAVLAGFIRNDIQGTPEEPAVSYRLRDVSGERITSFFADDGASAALLGPSPDPAAFFAALANAYTDGEPLLIAAAGYPVPALSQQQRQQVYGALAEAGWVNSITLAEADDKYRPDTQPVTLLRYIDPAAGYITQSYFQRLSDTHGRYDDLRITLDTHEPVLQQLNRLLFTAESWYWTGEQAGPDAANRGLAYLEEIDRITDEEFRGLNIDVDTPWLQRAMEATATVRIENDSGHPFSVDMVIEGEGVQLLEEYEPRVRIEPGTTVIEVPFVTDGWQTLEVRLSSGGTEIAADSAVIHPISGRQWIVILVALGALAAGIAYYLIVIRRAG